MLILSYTSLLVPEYVQMFKSSDPLPSLRLFDLQFTIQLPNTTLLEVRHSRIVLCTHVIFCESKD